LLARATVTSIFGLRASICASHDPSGAPRRLAWRTTALAPMISRLQIVRSPRLETAPSFCLPPVDLCSGVSPSQAAKSRPAGTLRRGHQRRDCRRDNRSYARDRHQPTCRRVCLRALVDLGIQRGDLRLQCGEGVDEQMQNDACALGQGGLQVLDNGDQGCDMADALREDVAEFQQVPAQSRGPVIRRTGSATSASFAAMLAPASTPE